jgi:ribosomal protein S10
MKKTTVILKLSASNESILDKTTGNIFEDLASLINQKDGLSSLRVEILPAFIKNEQRVQARRLTVEKVGFRAMDKLSKLDVSHLVDISIQVI